MAVSVLEIELPTLPQMSVIALNAHPELAWLRMRSTILPRREYPCPPSSSHKSLLSHPSRERTRTMPSDGALRSNRRRRIGTVSCTVFCPLTAFRARLIQT